MSQAGLGFCRIEYVFKLTLAAAFILFSMHAGFAVAEVAAGDDPNLAMPDSRHVEGNAGCLTGECNKKSDYDPLNEIQGNSKSIKDEADKALKKAINGTRYKIAPEDAAITAEEKRAIELKRLGEAANSDNSAEVSKEDAAKMKDLGAVSVGGSIKVKPSRHGVKVKVEGSF